MSALNIKESLTRKEKQLLATRYTSRQCMNWTTKELQDRVDLAQKYCRVCYQNDPSLQGKVLQIATSKPMWAFYLDGNTPKRVIGIRDIDQNILYTYSAHAVFNNHDSKGTPVSRLTRVDRWPEHILKRITNGFYPDSHVFLDPLGFIQIIMEKYCQLESSCKFQFTSTNSVKSTTTV